MQATSMKEVLLERRHYTPDQSVLWNKLSSEQKFSTNSLNQFGYDLAFVRNSANGNTAILLCNGNPATITDEGEINMSPQITVR